MSQVIQHLYKPRFVKCAYMGYETELNFLKIDFFKNITKWMLLFYSKRGLCLSFVA